MRRRNNQEPLPGLLSPNGQWTKEIWEYTGREIARQQQGLLISDWLLIGLQKGYIDREGQFEACEKLGLSFGTAVNAATVCGAFSQGC